MNAYAANSLAPSPASFEITEPLFTVGDVRKVIEAQARSSDQGLRRLIAEQPIFALAVASVLGFFLGRILAR